MRISDWSSDVCSSDLDIQFDVLIHHALFHLLCMCTYKINAGGRICKCEFDAATDQPVHLFLNFRAECPLNHDTSQGNRAACFLFPVFAKVHHLLQPFFLINSEEHTSELQSLMRISYAVF